MIAPVQDRPKEGVHRERALTYLLALFLVVVVFSVNVHGWGALASPWALVAELHGTRDAPASWHMGEEVPYCYRWLFRALVLSAIRIVPGGTSPEGFYSVFVAASGATLFLAAIAFEQLLRELGHTSRWRRLGLGLFFAGFPIVFAYDMPIHTREDFLAYGCVALELVWVARDRPWLLALTGAAAANVRETTALGLLPYLFVASRSRATRFAAVTPAFLAMAAVHVLRAPARAGVLPPQGITTNLAAPGESLLYLFASFGALWVLAAIRLVERRSQGQRDGILGWPQAAFAIGLALVTYVFLGMMRECRIVYVAAPWVVGLSLEYLASERFREVWHERAAWLVALLVLALGAWFELRIAREPELTLRLRSVIGESFQPGFEPPRIFEQGGESFLVYPYFASPWNGIHVLLQLGATAFVFAGEAARALRGRERVPGNSERRKQ
jgi:hypothetical protein